MPAVSPTSIPEFGGGLQLNHVASRWGAEIGKDRHALARGILNAYANGDFDALDIGEAILGLDYTNLTPFSVSKDGAKALATIGNTSQARTAARSIGYVALVWSGCIYVRPQAILSFAKARSLAPPTWLQVPESARSTKHPGGAPEKYNWAAAEAHLARECKVYGGIPRRGNHIHDWRTKADAYEVVRKFLDVDGEGGPSDTVLKQRVGPMLERIEEDMNRGRN